MIIVEHIKDGYEHSDGNAALVGILKLAFPDEKITIFSGRKHYEVITKYLKAYNLSTENIVLNEIKPFNKLVRDYKLIFFDFKIVKNIFDYAKKHNEDKIYFLYTSTFMLYYLKIFCFLNPKIKAATTLHGDIERIDLIRYSKSFQKNRFIMFLYALFFGLKIPLSINLSKNLKHITYGESIKKNAVKIIPSLNNRIIPIPHPYLYYNQPEKIPDENDLKFGTIGLLSRRKNIGYLEKLLSKINSLNLKNFSFLFTGIILDKPFYEFSSKLPFVDKSAVSLEFISSEKRDELIKKLDYVIFTYNFGGYKLIASGAFIDAINYEKPIIALKNDYLEFYFKKYGNIGFLLDSYEEFEDKILSILKNFSIQEYNTQVQNLRKIKENENIFKIVPMVKDLFNF